MAPRDHWGFAPDSCGVRIPEPVKHRTEARLRRYAEEQFTGRYTRLEIRFRGHFCYVDTYAEPEPLGPTSPPPDWPETREEDQERVRTTPIHLCRLRYFGDEERWGLSSYAYSHERYELSISPTASSSAHPKMPSRPRHRRTSSEHTYDCGGWVRQRGR